MDEEEIFEEEYSPKKSRYLYRKKQKYKHLKKRINNIQFGYYKGSLGYFNEERNHLCLPKDSNRQRYYKRHSNRVLRKYEDESIPKGSYYKKLFDYWWTID